jgi:N utilization substance protein B
MSGGPRHEAREAALQVLYFCEVGQSAPDDALEAYFAVHAPEADPMLRDFAGTLVRGTLGETAQLDALIGRHSEHWRVDRMAVIDRLVLRMAAWELVHEPETPPVAVINEALELTRTFSGDEAVGFVNGVLDGIRKGMASGRAAGNSDA